MYLYSLIDGYILLIVFKLPGGTVCVGVTILPLRDGLKVLVGRIVLLVRNVGSSELFST